LQRGEHIAYRSCAPHRTSPCTSCAFAAMGRRLVAEGSRRSPGSGPESRLL